MADVPLANSVDLRVGRNIARRRKALGLTQADLGRSIGVVHQTVQSYETGAYRVSASRLFAIAEALQVSPGDLFPAATWMDRTEGEGL